MPAGKTPIVSRPDDADSDDRDDVLRAPGRAGGGAMTSKPDEVTK